MAVASGNSFLVFPTSFPVPRRRRALPVSCDARKPAEGRRSSTRFFFVVIHQGIQPRIRPKFELPDDDDKGTVAMPTARDPRSKSAARPAGSGRRALKTDCTYFQKVLSKKEQRVEDSGHGDAFDKNVEERDEHGREHIKVRRITNGSFDDAVESLFGADKDNVVRSAFDGRILDNPSKWSENDAKVILHQVMHYAVGGSKTRKPRRCFAWHDTESRVALKVVHLICRRRASMSPFHKACTKNLKGKPESDWDIKSHAESAPPNGPDGTAVTGIWKVAGYTKRK